MFVVFAKVLVIAVHICNYWERRGRISVQIFEIKYLITFCCLNFNRKTTLYFAFSRISINNRLFLLLLGDPQIGCDPQTEFDCGGDGKMCIPLERVCNRKNDCGNWADEPKSLWYGSCAYLVDQQGFSTGFSTGLF